MVNPPVGNSNEQRNDDAVFAYLSKVEDFLIPDEKRAQTLKEYVKYFADLKCSLLPTSFTTVKPLSVHVNGFEPEQIYQQLQTINEERLKLFIPALVKLKSKTKTFGDLLRERSPSPELEVEDEKPADDEEEPEEVQKKEKKKKKSVTFYDPNALNKFLNEQDLQEMANSTEKINLDADDDDLDGLDDDDEDADLFPEEDNEAATYDEFFDPPDETKSKSKEKKKKKKNQKEENEEITNGDEHVDQEDEEEEEEEENLEGKSEFEKQQIRLKRQIKAIEKDMISAKPWQLTGEIEGPKRPENSLLEEFLQFDRTTRLPPVITNETTDTIEDLIKQRIRDKAFDDVERKKRTMNGDELPTYKKEIVLEHEKSQMSLAQIYEQEYVKKQSNMKSEKKDARHEKVRQAMEDLFVDLDALSNFRFTPKPPAPEVTIVNNLPAVLVEEVVPTTVNDATLLAPEEVHKRPKGDVKANSERTETDKKHERRLKKHKLKLKSQHESKTKKDNPEEDAKEEKRNLLKKLGKMKNVRIEKTDKKHSKEKTSRSSTKFFEKLQQSTNIDAPTKKKKRRSESTGDSKRLKL